MLSSRQSSADPALILRNVVVGCGMLVLGVAAEWVAGGFSDPRRWLPDLVTGWVVAGAGLLVWLPRHRSLVGPLLVIAGVAWFTAGFARPAVAAVESAFGAGAAAWVASVVFLAHRAPLAHAVLAFPSGRPVSAVERVSILAGYAIVALPVVWQTPAFVVLVATAFVLVARRGHVQAIGAVRLAKRRAALVAGALSAALIAGLIVRLLDQRGSGPEAALLLYELTIAGAAGALGIGLNGYRVDRTAVADAVVELGPAAGGGLRDALAEAIGDPSLQVGYWVADRSGYFDDSGRRVDVPGSGGLRAATRVDRGGAPLAILVHDPSLLGEPALVEGVAAAARLGSRNAALEAELRGHLFDLQVSRRRLIVSADEERQRLELRLREGARRTLDRLAADLEAAQAKAADGSATDAHIQRARELLAQTLADLADLAEGIEPADLRHQGLERALRMLSERSPIPIDLSVATGTLPGTIESAVYYLCAEAIANTVKHGQAGSMSVSVTESDRRIRVVVADDGRGGAEMRAGRGLAGLADRVAALEGTFAIRSDAGHGTALTAELPLDGEGQD